MKHTEQWETCDQCGKAISEERLSLELKSKPIDLGEERFNLNKGSSTYHWANRIWLMAEGVFCSVLCVENKFNGIMKEYMQAIDGKVDDLTTDLWGGAGPDCRTVPVLAG